MYRAILFFYAPCGSSGALIGLDSRGHKEKVSHYVFFQIEARQSL